MNELLKELEIADIRKLIRNNEYKGFTAGLAPGYTQANLVILPKDLAYDFLLFCQRNPKSCPLIEVTDIGSPVPMLTAPNSDLRFDLPKYHIYKFGKLVEAVNDIGLYWKDDFVAFLIGCSFTFEFPLIENGLSIRHIQENRNVPMYITNSPCQSSGVFHGNMVVSMRPFLPKDVIRAVQITSRFPTVHGAPIHCGNPETIGILDLATPNFGESVTINDGEIPVFWACGVTPQSFAMSSKPPLMITHAPGHMFITEVKDSSYSIF
ncbi:putative hydro-lyase [Neobacillus terrae]|uniref:putative hydro-lyase n=1 Tax=Neobacillus terrae TaxID=3034837 RepID=UPI00140753CC|nr:putative hydro-lyase [Neobacillus terrae]NHM31294.1 putative hydro-lyase [Neobacillus terrae]